MTQIKVIGLGAGDIRQLPYGVYQMLQSTDFFYIRTKEHPVIEDLMEAGLSFQTFDHIYEKHDQFVDVYAEIVEILMTKAADRDIVYAVPGHPMIAESTVQLLLEEAPARGIDIVIGGGQSFLDSLFSAIRIDPIDGFQMLDATSLKKEDIHMGQHLIIAQVYDAFIASDVKLTLMEKYPDDHKVVIVTAAGSNDEVLEKIPLYELDRKVKLNQLTSLYVPPVISREETYTEFATLRNIIADLRGPNGCPWDKEQTHLSLKKYLIEEAYELLDAIDRDNINHIIEELGDVLLQIMLHSQIGEDEGLFSIDDVIASISEKMVRRHPHVFGDEKLHTAKEVRSNWEEIKKTEKGETYQSKKILEKVNKGLPALLRAYSYQKEAGKVGFDWDDAQAAWEKVIEEMREFEVEIQNNNKSKQIDEFGDLLFAAINVARLLRIHPEEALQKANEKFYRRFAFVEAQVYQSGQSFEDYTLEQLDQFWDEAKRQGL